MKSPETITAPSGTMNAAFLDELGAKAEKSKNETKTWIPLIHVQRSNRAGVAGTGDPAHSRERFPIRWNHLIGKHSLKTR